MFEKLLSLAPYNPGLVHQLAFYGRRMHEEANIRRTGLVFIILAFFIQFFAVLNPPQPSLASSPNDLVSGGIGNSNTPLSTVRANASRACTSNARGFGSILAYYGISCGAFASATKSNINKDAQQGGEYYYSMGNNTSSCNDTGVNIPGAGRVYYRRLSCVGHVQTFDALLVRNSAGKAFYVLYDCGNLTSVGPPTQTLVMGPLTGGTALPGPTVTPTCQFNCGPPPPEYCKVPGKTNLPIGDANCFAACEYNPLLPAGDIKCKPCDESVSSADTTACINIHKTASNVTTGQADANNTTANPGDVITYTLYAENKGKATVKDYAFEENMNDVLDYSDITDLHWWHQRR